MRRFGMGLWALGLMITATSAVPVAAQMQKNAIPAPADQPYRFKHSGLTIPATLEDMPRKAIDQFGTDELDVFANFERGSDGITIYVYRNVSGAVPIWFDRASASVETRRDMYGTATASGPAIAFTPPGQSVASGLMGTWSVTKPPYRGTGLALMPMGDWLVKVRYSSATLDGAGIAARLPAILAALTWPTGLAAAAPAKPVADCATPLSFPKKAKVIRDEKSNMMSGLLGGMLQSIAAQKKAGEVASADAAATKPATWCRDPGASPIGAVYRADASPDSYLLAFSDAGRGAWVAPDMSGLLLGKKGGTRWSVALVDMGETSNFPSLTALPRPTEVLALVQQPAISSTRTWGDRTISINGGAMSNKR